MADLWGEFDNAQPAKAKPEAAELWAEFDEPAPRAAIPNAPLGEVTQLPAVVVRPEPEAPTLGGRAMAALGTLGTLPARAAGFMQDTVAPGVMGAFERSDLGGAITRGATSTLASGLHSASDFVDQTLQAPQRKVMELLQPTVHNRETGAVDEEATAELRGALSDPLGAQALAAESLGVEREIGADRQRAMAALGQMPTLGEAISNPQEAIARKGASLLTTGVESAPAMALAVATRNPELGSSILAGTTGAQEYTDLREQGVDRGQAIPAALLTAMSEKAGEQFGLEKILAPGRIASALPAIGSESAQEFGVQLAQGNIEDQALGRETPVMEQIKQAVDAGLIGAGFGGAAHGLSVGIDALAPREAAPFPNAAPRPQPAPAAPEAPQAAVIDPAVLAAGNAALGAAPVAPVAPAAPPLGQAEDTSDIDALLAKNIPPEVAAQAREVAANATPEQRQAAEQTLGDLLSPGASPEQQQAAMQALGAAISPTPAAPSEPASSPAVPASEPADGAAATNFTQQAAASMRMRAQEQAARTAAPAAQSPAAPVGSRSAGGDLADRPSGETVPPPSQATAAPAARKRAVKTDSARKPMDLLRVLAANGGLNREAFRAQGVDPAEFTRRAGFNYLFRKKGGMGVADLREFMQQEGYLARDAEGGRAVVDDNDAFDVFDRAFRSGEEIYSDDQADAVASMRAARKQADEEYQAELAGDPDWSALSEEDFDASQRSEIAALTERAYDLGATDEQIVGAAFDAENNEHHRQALTQIVERLERDGTEQEAADGLGESRAQPRQEAEPASRGDAFALGNSEPASARQEVAPTQGGGLFGAPTARDFVDSAQRSRDAARNGQTGTGRTDMLSGDGELFAGARPEQARVPDAADGAPESTETPLAGSDLAEVSRRMGEADAERLGLRAAVNEALGKVGEKVIFLRDYSGLPEKQRKGIEQRMQQREGRGRTAALYDPNTKNVYVFTKVVRTPDRAVWNAAHEIGGHEGLRTLLGARLDHALGIALQNPTVAAVADAIAAERALRPNQRMLAAEEALAELAAAVRTGNFDEIETRYAVPVPEGIRERLTRAIENFLKRLKAMIDDVFGRHQFTDEDVRALLENAWQAVNAPANGELAPDLDGFDATAPDQTQTPAFRKWFGASKVVDDQGKPLVVYHGAPDARFMDADATFMGMGDRYGARRGVGAFWFARDRGTAASYADDRRAFDYQNAEPQVIPAYLKLENPLVVDGGGKAWREAQAIGKATDVIEKAQAEGHDGVIIRNVRDNYNNGPRTKATDTYVVFDSRQIKSATANSGNFDPSNPSILESVDDVRGRAEARRNEAAGTLPIARGAAGWNYDAGKWEGRKGQASNARAALQDKMLAWRDVQGQVEANLQAAIPDAQNVYRLENLMHGRVSEGIDRIEREQVKPLVDAMRAAKIEPATLEQYLYARHAQERNEQIAEINPAMPDGGSGMTNAEAAKILASADKATLEPLAKRVDAIAKATRRRLLANGLITQEAFDAMDAQYSHYVPLRGKSVEESQDFGGEGMAGRGLDSRGKPVRNAMGRGAGNRAQHILGEVIGDAERSVILAEKARVGRAVMRVVLANPNPALWQVEPVNTERALDASGEVYEKVVNDWSDPSVVAVRHKGQLYRVQINSVPLAKALNNVGVDQIGSVTRMAGAVNRYFSAILTKYNPAFTPVNATRDALFGLTGLAAEHGEAAALDAALHYPQAARAAFRQARGASGGGQWDTWAKEFAEAGGKTGYVNMPSAEEIARKIGSGSLTSYSPTGLRRAASVVGEAVGVLNDAVENALRLSAYVTLRKRGSAPEAAAAYAKDLTVNFNRKGFDGSKLNAWFLFYNASIQGAHRVSKLARKPKTWAYLGALATAQVIATMAAMGMEDDNGEPLWNKVPDHVKRRNLVIVTPDGGMVTIPMPYGFNLFPYMAGRIAESVANGQRGEKRASDSAAQLTADFIGSGLESFSPVPLDDGVAGLLPTLLRIPTNVWANKNDFGNRIRNEQPYAKSDVPRASMGRPDTMELFKLAAKGLNRIGGGDDLTPPPMSAFDLAPEDLEYLVKTFAGGPGNLIVDIATVGQKITGGNYAQDADARDIPITKRFVSNIDEQAAQAAMFYDRRETIDRSLKRVRLAFKNEGAEAGEALLVSTPELKGAKFKRRKGEGRHGEAPGTIILTDGNPQIVVGDSASVFGRYKAAEEAITARNENVETAYSGSPAGLRPNRERDAYIRTENGMRQAAQSEFNAAWVRDVVGSAEPDEFKAYKPPPQKPIEGDPDLGFN